MDELLKMWKDDKINSINRQIEECDNKMNYYQSLVEHNEIMKNQTLKEKTDLEAVLQKLLSFSN